MKNLPNSAIRSMRAKSAAPAGWVIGCDRTMVKVDVLYLRIEKKPLPISIAQIRR